MGLRDTFLNLFTVETPEVQKVDNQAWKSSRDFLRNGNREELYPSWADVKMSDSDMYRGYSYAVIQKRGNKVASLARENLITWANPETVDEFQKKDEQVFHPYLTLIENSTDFTEKQFWKNISIYLDLAGKYYLGVIRNEVKPLNPNLPVITTDPVKFVMLNPYEIRRVVNDKGECAGYIERKKDGRYREWPLHQIIEMKELNPFDPEGSQWAMTDAAKDAVYTINQSADYTRQSLNGNIDAPGIITTDVLLNDEDFANFRARVVNHTKGEPLFGNGTGAINWESMQIDLDKAALLDINEINRTTLFAVSGTSKTSLGIEQSGTTRETSKVQSEQFVSDTAQPRLEDIVDFLNLDYKKHYNREFKKTGYSIEVKSAVGRDYENETKATTMRQVQVELALSLMQKGYTKESAYQYATGDIEIGDLELEKGLDKPNLDDGSDTSDDNGGDNPSDNAPTGGPVNNELEAAEKNVPTTHAEAPRSDSGSEDDSGIVSGQNGADLNELEPHKDLVENGGKGSGNFGHAGRPGEIGGSGKGSGISVKKGKVSHKKYSTDGQNLVAEWDETEHPIFKGVKIIKTSDTIGVNPNASDDMGIASTAYNVRDGRLKNPFDVWGLAGEEDKYVKEFLKVTFNLNDDELESMLGVKNSVEGENSHPFSCSCGHEHKAEKVLNELRGENGKVAEEAFHNFLDEVRKVEKDAVVSVANKLTINAFEESDLITERKKNNLIAKLKNALYKYWWIIYPMFASNAMSVRNDEFDENISFVFTNELQGNVDKNADKVAKGHIETILEDILEACNRANDKVLEEAAAKVIIDSYEKSEKIQQYFDEKPDLELASKVIRNTDILEKNRKIYDKANKMVAEGYNRAEITKAIRAEYKNISEKRAELIANNETSRAFSWSQFDADRQFLNSVGKLDKAYKVLYSTRPESEKDKICEFCAELIKRSNENPVPFDEPFLAYGDSIEIVNDKGQVKVFTANYEDIQGGVCHVNCACRYKLVFKNDSGEFVKTLNFNPNHEPAGSPKGGQFTKAEGGHNSVKDFVQSDIEAQCKQLEEIWTFGKKDIPNTLNIGNLFQQVSYRLGNNDAPKVVSTEEFDKLGESPLYRFVNDNIPAGMAAEEVKNDFLYGQNTYQGDGDYCAGIHFSENLDHVSAEYNLGNGALIEAKLKSGVKVLDLRLAHEPSEVSDRIVAFRKTAQKSGLVLPQGEARALATFASGYDCLVYRYNTDAVYTVALNRECLVVKKTNNER